MPAIMAWAVACGRELYDPPDYVTAESEHIRLHHAPDTPVCAGTLDYMEAAVLAQAGVLELDIRAPIDYFLLRPAEWWSRSPCPDALACAIADRVYARLPAVDHELVHALERQHHDAAAPLFAEGLAVALGDEKDPFVLASYDVAPDSLLDADEVDYDIAGDFVSYLLLRHGARPFDELLGRATAGASSAEVRSVFSSIYGRTLLEATAERWSSGWRFLGGELKVPQCAAPAIPWDGLSWVGQTPIDCSTTAVGYDTDTLVVGYESAMLVYRTLDVPTAGTYRIEASQPASSALSFTWCPLGQRAEEPVDTALVGTARRRGYRAFVQLRPGRYSVRATASWPEPAAIDWSIDRATLPSCTAPLDVDPTSPSLLALPPPGESMILPIRFAAEASMLVHAGDGQQEAVQLCSDCSLADCAPIAGWVTFRRGERRVLVVRAAWEALLVADFGAPAP